MIQIPVGNLPAAWIQNLRTSCPSDTHSDHVISGMKIDIADYAGSWSLVRRLDLKLNRLYLKLIDTTPSHHNSS